MRKFEKSKTHPVVNPRANIAKTIDIRGLGFKGNLHPNFAALSERDALEKIRNTFHWNLYLCLHQLAADHIELKCLNYLEEIRSDILSLNREPLEVDTTDFDISFRNFQMEFNKAVSSWNYIIPKEYFSSDSLYHLANSVLKITKNLPLHAHLKKELKTSFKKHFYYTALAIQPIFKLKFSRPSRSNLSYHDFIFEKVITTKNMNALLRGDNAHQSVQNEKSFNDTLRRHYRSFSQEASFTYDEE